MNPFGKGAGNSADEETADKKNEGNRNYYFRSRRTTGLSCSCWKNCYGSENPETFNVTKFCGCGAVRIAYDCYAKGWAICVNHEFCESISVINNSF